MKDTARQFIDDTMAQLAVWRADLADRYSVGRKHWNNQRGCPWIWWAYGALDHDDADNHGWTDKEIQTEEQTLQIKIWGTASQAEKEADNADEEFVRTLKNDLFRALRVAAGGPQINYGAFDWVSEQQLAAGYSNKGAVLQGSVIVRLPVRQDPSTQPTQFHQLTGATLRVLTEHPDEELQQTIVIPPA